MLVGSEGALRSGSTWLFSLPASLRQSDWPEAVFLTKDNARHPATAEPRPEESSLGSLREKHQDAPSHRAAEADFFRKGEIGDWRNYFDDKILADHDRICCDGISPLGRRLVTSRLKQKIRRAFA